jgi:hypothetical protein
MMPLKAKMIIGTFFAEPLGPKVIPRCGAKKEVNQRDT